MRLLLFWISSDDDVGGARMTWRQDGPDERIITVLVGSHPQRAPRRINAWGYLREEVRGNAAAVFAVGSLPDAHSPDDAESRFTQSGPGPATFGAFCSSISSTRVDAAVGMIRAGRDVTYERVPALLQAAADSAEWTHRTAARPDGAAPGFLMAVNALLETVSEAARSGGLKSLTIPPAAYIYRDQVFDLRVRGLEHVPVLELPSETFRDLVRTEFITSNRKTGSTMKFTVTHPIDGPLANVPVHATVQPNRWFRVELRLDDRWHVASDPASDPDVLQRIADLCLPCTTRNQAHGR